MKEVKHFAAAGGKGKGPGTTPEMEEAWTKMIEDSDPIMWVIAEYDPSGKSLSLKETGTNWLAEFKEHLAACEGVAWAGFRCNGVDNRGSVVCKRPKFIFVQYMPDGANAMRKAKMGSHKGALKQVFDKAHLDVCVANVEEDLNEDALAKSLQSATGAHKPNGYEFDPGKITNADYYGDT